MSFSSVSRLAKGAAKRTLPRWLLFELRKRYSKNKRARLSSAYIRGNGVEIGALSIPLPTSKRASVKYVDCISEARLRETYPDLSIQRLDYIENGFELPSFSEGSTDFVIANHVLEHSPNPIQPLRRWLDVLRPEGILFAAVPIREHCFDRGRELTSLDHLIADYDAYASKEVEIYRRRNRAHVEEWLDTSAPAIHGTKYLRLTPQQREMAIEDHIAREQAIHFHTFSVDSYRALLTYVCSALAPQAAVLEVIDNDFEVIGILRKTRWFERETGKEKEGDIGNTG